MLRSETHPAARAAGGFLRDARERYYILPEQAAGLLRVSEESVIAMEAGHHGLSFEGIRLLCDLYRCSDEALALSTLAHAPAIPTPADQEGVVRDLLPGHDRRLAGCTRQARRVRWLSTVLIPPPLQTAEYALAVGLPPIELPGVPLPGPEQTVFVLDEEVLVRGRITARLMARQLLHLLDVYDGSDIRVVPGRMPMPRSSGHLVELLMPAGPVLARVDNTGVAYLPDSSLSARIDEIWSLTTPAASRNLLVRAADDYRHRVGLAGVY
ncbi:helix-turn-helix transcriptional regulator (plasmid) [Streptomyces sp. NBC_01724]|uniref:Scr1 family TA system antitoxin-like transcriptional regulator n=1 Tax=unclassified Streptomyces TaxID=2593676 RepID=UPI002E36C5A6|nr:Scr1 family TA system antitoxin-like transcriptional regulator [Streptomyces sp. NBC_01724]